MQSDQPFDTATCMWYTGIGPFTKKAVPIARNLRDRRMQRALMPFFKPENYFLVRDALAQAGRADLVGGCGGLVSAHPPTDALAARKRDSDAAAGVGAKRLTSSPGGRRLPRLLILLQPGLRLFDRLV